MAWQAVLADAILVLHAGVVLFVVLGQVLILAGGAAGWRWVRHRPFRLVHLCVIAYVVVQSWLGQLCPLTLWEHQLRRAAGQAAYEASFVEHWVSRLLYYEAPGWVFALVYTVFGALVAASWFWVRPRSPG